MDLQTKVEKTIEVFSKYKTIVDNYIQECETCFKELNLYVKDEEGLKELVIAELGSTLGTVEAMGYLNVYLNIEGIDVEQFVALKNKAEEDALKETARLLKEVNKSE